MFIKEDYELGYRDEELQIQTREENTEVHACMVSQSRRYLDIISRELDPQIYDQNEFLDAVKNLAINGSRAQIRIIVFDVNSIIRKGHRMIELAAKLSSFIEIKKGAHQDDDYNDALLIADRTGFILRNDAQRYEARLNFNDKRQSYLYLNQFEDMWERARPDPNFRRVLI